MEIPDYVEDEIERYKWKKENGKSGIATYENVKALLNLAVVNNRIAREEATEVMKSIVDKI